MLGILINGHSIDTYNVKTSHKKLHDYYGVVHCLRETHEMRPRDWILQSQALLHEGDEPNTTKLNPKLPNIQTRPARKRIGKL